MRADDFASRLHARRIHHGWIARCPAHPDRSPSLAISEGRDKRIVLHCHAGCETPAIVAALDLSLRDLFSTDMPGNVRPPPHDRRTDAEQIESALRDELALILAEESERCDSDVAPLTRHRNQARSTIERRYDVSLSRERTPWWEIDPHALDPEWRGCVAQALRVLAAESGFRPATIGRVVADLPEMQDRVLRLARRYQRELCETSTRVGAAA